MIKNIANRVIKLPVMFFEAVLDIYKSTKTLRPFEEAEVDFIYHGRVRRVKALVTKDLKWVKPKGVNRKWAIKGSYINEETGNIQYYCYLGNPYSLDFENIPKKGYNYADLIEDEDLLKKMSDMQTLTGGDLPEDIKDDTLNEIIDNIKDLDLLDFKDYEVTGGAELTEFAELLTTSTIIGILAPPNKKDILYIAIITGLLFTMIGFFLGTMFWLIVT